jgi:hypothetical protein
MAVPIDCLFRGFLASAIMQVRTFSAKIWSAVTCHRFNRLTGLPAKQSRVQRFAETAPQLSSTATSRLPKAPTSPRTPNRRGCGSAALRPSVVENL